MSKETTTPPAGMCAREVEARIKDGTLCPTCLSPVKVVGDETKHYEPDADALRPCPFCGSEVKLREQYSQFHQPGDKPMLFRAISCPKCLHFFSSTEDADSKKKRWNTRPIEDALRAKIFESDKALSEFRSKVLKAIESALSDAGLPSLQSLEMKIRRGDL